MRPRDATGKGIFGKRLWWARFSGRAPSWARSAGWAIPLAGLLVIGSGPATAGAQQVTVTGVVIEASRSSWIGGALVRLSGSPPHLTDVDGRFRFEGVAPGRHTLTVEAYGYRSRTLELRVRTDTVLRIEMEPDPIVLDSLMVAAEDVTIEGTIVDASTGDRVLYAEVTVYPGGRTTGAVSGGFTLRDVPGGRATTVVVEALEYLPARIALITGSDTSLTVELEPDPVAARMIAQQARRLEVRSWSVPFATTSLGRGDVTRTGLPIVDLIRHRLDPGLVDSRTRLPATSCLFIDDQRVWPEALRGLVAGQVERIEIFGRGRMIRVYTVRYTASLMGEPVLPAIIYIAGGLGSLTCH